MLRGAVSHHPASKNAEVHKSMARLRVRAHPGAKRNEIRIEGNTVHIWVTAPARDGKANKAIIELLARKMRVKKSEVSIVQGEHGREKIIEVPDDAASRLLGQTA